MAPIWNIIYSLGLLMGIGGAVLFSTIRGKGDGQTRRSNEYFTVSILGAAVLAAAQARAVSPYAAEAVCDCMERAVENPEQERASGRRRAAFTLRRCA